jgi:uncharacterized membrane protein required for colicin V production
MGLDLALGAVILLAAIRGWMQGFVSQSVRLASIVACVYLADPVRNRAKPYVLPYLTSIQPELIDVILWWVSAVVSCVVMIGFVTLIIKISKRPELPGMPPPQRNDQFAGFLLGAAKGLLIVTFAVAGIQKYAVGQIKTVAWAEEQMKASWALKWNDEYQPAARIWASRPVQHFVGRIRQMGLKNPGDHTQPPGSQDSDGEPAVRTAHRDPELRISSEDQSRDAAGAAAGAESAATAPRPGLLDPETEKTIAEIKAELKARAGAKDPN